MKSEILTHTGKLFDFLNPTSDMICIEDIAHSLSNLCRYTGHTRKFYSVAQHCILMAESDKCPGDPLSKLLHDSAEAYIGDIASPLKRLLRVDNHLPYYETVKCYEFGILKTISQALGYPIDISAEVKKSDKIMLATEVRDLMPQSDVWKTWDLPEPLETRIYCETPATVEWYFLDLYKQLT